MWEIHSGPFGNVSMKKILMLTRTYKTKNDKNFVSEGRTLFPGLPVSILSSYNLLSLFNLLYLTPKVL